MADSSPPGSHAADLQALRATQAALEASQKLLRESRSVLEAFAGTRDLRQRIADELKKGGDNRNG